MIHEDGDEEGNTSNIAAVQTSSKLYALDFGKIVVYFNVMKIPESEKIKQWCQNRGIDLCILFGSQATGKARPDSDTDIALFSQTNPALQKNLLGLYGELEDLFGHEVDLVIIKSDTDPVLRLEVFQHGKTLYESQPGLFIEQSVFAVKLFDDTEPLRRWRRRVLAQRILNLKYVNKNKYVPSYS